MTHDVQLGQTCRGRHLGCSDTLHSRRGRLLKSANSGIQLRITSERRVLDASNLAEHVELTASKRLTLTVVHELVLGEPPGVTFKVDFRPNDASRCIQTWSVMTTTPFGMW